MLQLHPKSENLSEMVKDIVSKLEQGFDDLPSRMITSPTLGTTWKKEALDTTLNEIPRIPIAGTETGITPGFGQYIYQTRDTIDPRKTVIHILTNSTHFTYRSYHKSTDGWTASETAH